MSELQLHKNRAMQGPNKMIHPGPHKLMRVSVPFPRPHDIYRCMLPNCDHRVQDYMILGKESECWDCAKGFIISRPGKKKPLCDDCRDKRYGIGNKKIAVDKDALSKLLENVND